MNSSVTKIEVEHGRATGIALSDGTRIRAKAVISNADLKHTFLQLVDQHDLPADFRARIEAAQPAASAFMVHLGVDFVPDVKPAVHVFGELSFGIETLSLVDPAAAPPGHSTVGIIALVPHAESERWFPSESADDWKEWRHSSAYAERKAELGNRLIAAAERVIPGLSRHIVCRDDASPVTYALFDRTSDGAIYGISRAGRLRGAKSPIRGLAVAGSATHGPGVEAAVISGAFAAVALVPNLLASACEGQTDSALALSRVAS